MAEIWSYQETRDSEYARVHLGDYRIEVQDMDGDLSEWTISDDTGVIASGRCLSGNHFEACKAAAWATIHSFESVPTGFVMTFGGEGD